MFTGVIKLANIDDYIAPSQQCVKPLMETPLKAKEVGKATVTLNDCLACSGCVTTAQTILIEQMGIAQFSRRAKEQPTIVMLSPQSRASLARYYKLSQQQLMSSLQHFFRKHFKVQAIYDIQQAIQLCHAHIFQEFRKCQSYPIMCSECPGWVCYAEKVAPPEVIPHMSKVKSPQQIMASLIRDRTAYNPYIMAIMPCFDKKLEAIRFEYAEKQKEVDLVLGTKEISQLINITQKCGCSGVSCGQNCQKCNSQRFPYNSKPQPDNEPLAHVEDPKSNGYIHFLLKKMQIPQYKAKQIRNVDFIEYEFIFNGKPMKMAKCYGFRNIQNVVRSIKDKKCQYAYIEIMACPSGCFNGGAQMKQENVKPKDLASQLENQTLQECKLIISSREIDKKSYQVEYKAIEKSVSLLNW